MAICPSCKATVEDGSDLCMECGEPMSARPATARPAPPAAPPARPGAPPPPPKTMPGTPIARKKWPAEEPEPVRCPGCGAKSHAVRCPNCGTRLRKDDD